MTALVPASTSLSPPYFELGKCACSEERNTYSKGLAACIGSSTLKASRVLLEGVASGAIARGSPINYDQLALSIRI